MTDTLDWFSAKPTYILLEQEDGNPLKLRSHNGAILVTIELRAVEVIGSGTKSVSTSTPLTDWLDLTLYDELLFVVSNPSVTEVYVTLDVSDGTLPDVNSYELTIPAGKQGSFKLADTLQKNHRLSAYSAGFVAATLNWSVRGILRA